MLELVELLVFNLTFIRSRSLISTYHIIISIITALNEVIGLMKLIELTGDYGDVIGDNQ